MFADEGVLPLLVSNVLLKFIPELALVVLKLLKERLFFKMVARRVEQSGAAVALALALDSNYQVSFLHFY